jgi:hypothetical protein
MVTTMSKKVREDIILKYDNKKGKAIPVTGQGVQ